jgi:hypothetical protein
MDLGEVVEIIRPDFALTTPSPQAKLCSKAILLADTPLLKQGGETFGFHIHIFGFQSYSLWG